MKIRLVRHIGWFLFGICLILAITGLALWSTNGKSLYIDGPPTYDQILLSIALPIWALVGALLASKKPNNPIGWLYLIIALVIVMDDFAFGYAYYGIIFHPGSLPGAELMVIWLYWGGPVFASFGITLLLILFPTGKPLSQGWGRLIWISALAAIIYILVGVISPNPLATLPFSTELIIFGDSISGFMKSVMWITLIVALFCVFAAVISVFIRLSRATGIERQQLKWFVFAAFFFIPGSILAVLGLTLDISAAPMIFTMGIFVMLVFMIGIPVASAIAILRYRLWDIDLIIRRTLIYGLLTGAVALIYFITVIVLQQILQRVTGQQSPLAIVLSTLVIAAMFSSLRQRIQDFIDKHFYRQQYDAAETLAQFALKVQDEVNLEALVDDLLQIVDRTMNPESLSIWLKED